MNAYTFIGKIHVPTSSLPSGLVIYLYLAIWSSLREVRQSLRHFTRYPVLGRQENLRCRLSLRYLTIRDLRPMRSSGGSFLSLLKGFCSSTGLRQNSILRQNVSVELSLEPHHRIVLIPSGGINRRVFSEHRELNVRHARYVVHVDQGKKEPGILL